MNIRRKKERKKKDSLRDFKHVHVMKCHNLGFLIFGFQFNTKKCFS